LKPGTKGIDVTTGASKVNADRSVPTAPSTVSVTSSEAPNPVGTEQDREVLEDQDVVRQTVAPTRTVGEVSE